MRKKNIRMYQVLATVVVFALVVSFGINIVKAQDEASVLDKVIQILSFSKGQEAVDDAGDQTLGTALQNGEFVITKKIDLDDITTTGADVTNIVTGDFYVDNVVIEMGGYTIASGTLIQILTSGDAYGTSTPLFSTQVSNFTKTLSMDLNTAISTSGAGTGLASSTQRVILEDGSKLIIKCTGADCKQTTAAGVLSAAYLRVTTILKKVNSWSNTYE